MARRDHHDPDERQGDLYSVRAPNRVPGAVSDGGPEAPVQVRGVSEQSGDGEPSPAQRDAQRRPQGADRRPTPVGKKNPTRTRYKKCDVCGLRFAVKTGEEWKGRCGECASALREAKITCPGCGKQIPYKRGELVKIFVNPGKEGGKQYEARYCMMCISGVKSKAAKINDNLKREVQRSKDVQRQWTREVHDS